MADEEFEIDIYGDAPADAPADQQAQTNTNQGDSHSYTDDAKQDNYEGERRNDAAAGHEDDSRHRDPPQQGVKRKGGSENDDRPLDPGATSALMLSELNWWVTDDGIRGYARAAGSEDELKDVTFSEHKVNGKSKGQVYVEFTSQHAATAVKRHIDSLFQGEPGQVHKKIQVSYSMAGINPFRTLPKDGPSRSAKEGQGRPMGGSNYSDGGQNNPMGVGTYNRGNYRGRGGFNTHRGNMQHNQTGYNRNFSAGSNMGGGGGGYNNQMFNPMATGNFGFNRGGGNMMNMGMQRGGGGGMRGNRGGGMGNAMMGMGNPMGGGMPNMPNMSNMPNMPNMGMNMMGPGMQGFGGGMQNPFNPGFFPQMGGNMGGGNMGGGNQEWGNPHGAKRPRPE